MGISWDWKTGLRSYTLLPFYKGFTGNLRKIQIVSAGTQEHPGLGY